VEWNKAKLEMVIFGIVAIAFAYLDIPTYLIQMCVVGIAVAGGWELRGEIVQMKEEALIGAIFAPKEMPWHRYYLRVIGYFLAFGGFGLIADELVRGYLDFTTLGHEWYGVILFLIGLGLISVKPKGK